MERVSPVFSLPNLLRMNERWPMRLLLVCLRFEVYGAFGTQAFLVLG